MAPRLQWDLLMSSAHISRLSRDPAHSPESGASPTLVAESARQIAVRWMSGDWPYRILIGLATLAFLHVFPTILFVVYMGTKGFFDYGFFREGPFSIAVFYGTAELLTILAALTMFGIAVPLWEGVRHKRWRTLHLLGVGVFNAVVLIAVFSAVVRSRGANLVDGIVFVALGLIIAAHIAVLLHESARTALASLLVVFTIVGSMVAIWPASMANLLALGLRTYRVGGDVPVTLVRRGQTERVGRLIFLGPSQLFVHLDGDLQPRILEREPGLEILLGPTAAPSMP